MSYEGRMLVQHKMPNQKRVEEVLLQKLLIHGGVIPEFAAGQTIVHEIADEFGLSDQQRSAFLETTYLKEDRIKKSFLWHRLLFRAADHLAKEKIVSRLKETVLLAGKREWMLTEKGFDEALRLQNHPASKKYDLPIKSYEVQKIAARLAAAPRLENYDPFDKNKKVATTTIKSALRDRAFRQAVVEAYGCRCSICGLKLRSPDCLSWEVQAAHIVPNRVLGRDDICNGIALCHFHHLAFDVGWIALSDDYKVRLSAQITQVQSDNQEAEGYRFLRLMARKTAMVHLPEKFDLYPHVNAIRWHRENVFFRPSGIQ